MELRRVRDRVWRVLEPAREGDRPSRLFDLAIRALIGLNVVAVILETVPALEERFAAAFYLFELFSVAVFSAEYVLRVWSCTASDRYSRPVRGRLRFAVSPLALIDLLAVLPAYLPAVGVDLRMLRGARLFRLFRILKLARYSEALRLFGRVFRRKRPHLVITLSLVGFVMLVASTVMYHAEHAAQPDVFASIPHAMWWAVVTLTTVGYGDVVPVTLLGRLMAGLFAVTALFLIAVPTAILGAGFMEEMDVGQRASGDDGGADPGESLPGERGAEP